ncbi:MAG TPA: hypothetical protein PLL77_10905 [Pyrinomonadaceae bacterium]|nr:hypothetical protein [Pyrinomonadaceae bacterium]
MLSFTRRRLIVLFVFVALAIFAGFRFGPGSRAAKPATSAMVGGPLITATMTAAPVTDVGANGAFVNPGDTLEYTVTINNTGDPASGVVFTDNLTDANLTLVPGSIKASPIASDETFLVTGNVRIQKSAGTLLSNDFRPTTGNNTGLTITAIGSDVSAPFSFTTTNGGTVTAATGDGSFQYNPPPGFEGTAGAADSFTYTITDPDGLTGTGTVRFDVSGMIWFVDTSAATNGDGRLTSPYNCFVGAGCFDPTAPDDPGDNIFLYTGGTNTGGITLLANQKLIGQGASATLASIAGITLAADSDALPATVGTNPVITTGGANAITLGSGGNVIRGLTVGNVGAGTKIFGNGFGTVTIGNNTTPDVALSGTGKAIDLTNGTFAASSGFISVASTSSGSQGINLNTLSGTVSFGTTTIQNSTTQGINIAGSSATMTFGTTQVSGTGTQRILIGTTTGNVTFGNTTLTGGTDGLSLQNNSSGTRTFGTLTVSGGSSNAFIHGAGGGNVTVTGVASLTSVGEAILVSANTGNLNFQGATSATTTQSGIFGVVWQGSGGSATFASLSIQTSGANATGLFAQGGGTINVTNGTGTINATPVAAPAVVANGVALNANFAAVNSTGGTNGVSLTNVTGTSDFGAGALSGSSSSTFQVSGGTCSTTYTGSLTQANNAPLVSISGGHNTGTVTFNAGTIGATNGTGLQFDNADGIYNFNGPTTLNGGDAGIDIVNGSSGTLTFGINTAITNPTGIAYREDTGTAVVSYSGTITKTNGPQNAISINGKTSGSTTFSGFVSATTTTANAINLTNTGGTVTFRNGMLVTTTSGTAFNAVGAGQTINVCDENPCNPAATGTGDNRLTSSTGTALNVQNSTIGANNMEFRLINSNGGSATGIILISTGSTGSLVVKGDGNTSRGGNGSGGTITNKTGGTDGDGTTASAVYVNNGSATLRNMVFTRLDNFGLYGLSVNSVTLQYSQVGAISGSACADADGDIGSSSGAQDAAIVFGKSNPSGLNGFNNSGTFLLDNLLVRCSIEHQIEIYAQSNTFSGTISNSDVKDNSTGFGSDGILIETQGTSSATISVNGNAFDDNKSQPTQGAANDSSFLDLTINNNTVVRSTQGNEGFVLSNGSNGDLTAHVTNNNISGINGVGIFVGQTPGNATAASQLIAVISGNTIVHGAAATNHSIWFAPTSTVGQVSNANVLIQNNNVTQNSTSGTVRGILVDNPDANTSPSFTASVLNNSVAVGDNVNGVGGLVVQARQGQNPPNTAGCFDIRNNSVTYPNGTPAGVLGLRVRQATNGVASLEQGSSAGTAAVVVAANNPAATTEALGTIGVVGNSTCQNAPTLALPEVASIVSFTGSDTVDAYAMASVERNVIGSEIVAETTGWELAQASASVETTDTVIWQKAIAEAIPADVVPVTNTPSLLAEVYNKVTSQISPTVYSQGTEKESAPEAGTVTVNGSGSGFALPTNKSTTITFRAAISNPTTPVNTFAVSNQGSVSGTGFTTVQTDGDAGTAGAQPTTTVVVQPPTITKSFTPANILLDQQSTLTLTINNTNPAQAVTGITVTDVFPANVVVATPLTASTTCGAGTLQNNSGGVLAVGDPGIKLVGGTRPAAQSCTVTVKVRGTVGGTYVNTTGNVASFEGFVGTTASSTLNVSVLTASELSISGRVTTAEGRGIRGAVVTITGNSLTSPINLITGVNGTYSVEGLAAGETYIVTVRSRRFAFESPSRVVTLIDNVTDADFIGLQGTGREQ